MSPHALIAQWVKVKIHTKDIIAYLEVNVHSLTEQQPTQTQTWVVFFELVLIFKTIQMTPTSVFTNPLGHEILSHYKLKGKDPPHTHVLSNLYDLILNSMECKISYSEECMTFRQKQLKDFLNKNTNIFLCLLVLFIYLFVYTVCMLYLIIITLFYDIFIYLTYSCPILTYFCPILSGKAV